MRLGNSSVYLNIEVLAMLSWLAHGACTGLYRNMYLKGLGILCITYYVCTTVVLHTLGFRLQHSVRVPVQRPCVRHCLTYS